MSELDKEINTPDSVKNNIDPKESPFKPLLDNPDKYLWLLCTVPVLGSLLISAMEVNEVISILIYVVPNIALALLDEKSLTKREQVAPAHWTVLIVPVYIWQRLKLNGQKKGVFYAWIVSFFVSFLIDNASYDSAIETQSCELVTQIIHEQYFNNSTDCLAVSLGDSVTSDFYKGVATLSNGNDLNITVDLRKEGEIYVQIVN